MITDSYVAFGVEFGEIEGQQDTLYGFEHNDILTVMACRQGHEDIIREEISSAIGRIRIRLDLVDLAS